MSVIAQNFSFMIGYFFFFFFWNFGCFRERKESSRGFWKLIERNYGFFMDFFFSYFPKAVGHTVKTTKVKLNYKKILTFSVNLLSPSRTDRLYIYLYTDTHVQTIPFHWYPYTLGDTVEWEDQDTGNDRTKLPVWPSPKKESHFAI